MNKYTKICILKGGVSTEREVSLLTAESYAKALRDLNIDFIEFDFSEDLPKLISFIKSEQPDCILNALHGGSGENGRIQSVLDMMKIPYTHSGVGASSAAMNKHLSRLVFKNCGLRVPPGKLVRVEDINSVLNDIAYPIVIKPISEGSSVGVHIIEHIDEFKKTNWRFGEYALVEKYIPGIELSVGVIDGKPLAVTKIGVQSGFYDYHNKYSDGCSFHEVPAKIPESVYEEAMNSAVVAHNALNCRGITRSDFRYDPNECKLYILEINNQPGMTSNSLVPEQARYVGISFNQLVKDMVDKACFDI